MRLILIKSDKCFFSLREITKDKVCLVILVTHAVYYKYQYSTDHPMFGNLNFFIEAENNFLCIEFQQERKSFCPIYKSCALCFLSLDGDTCFSSFQGINGKEHLSPGACPTSS